MRLAVNAARRLLPTDPDRADGLLAAVRAETERTGDAVQRMLARLRPAPIGEADADLLAAVIAHGDQLAERAGLQVVVGADGALPALPADVIEAAYRIAVEAMTNTARHAAARRCTVRLRAAEDLTVEVSDDGCGLPEPPRPRGRLGVDAAPRRRAGRPLRDRCGRGRRDQGAGRPAAGGASVIRVLVVEDHPMYREGLRASLALDAAMVVVAAVGTAADAVAAVTRYPVDVVLMDLQLPDGSGVAATREVLTRRPGCRVLVVSSHDDEVTVTAAVRAGARGYLTKDADGAEIARAVRAVATGDSMFTGTVVDALARGLVPRIGPAASAFPQLTGREQEVLALLAAGHSNAFIADHFVLSLKTVRNHVSSTFAKLGVASRAEAIVAARRAGLGESAPPYPD